jgi:hypothetical protein
MASSLLSELTLKIGASVDESVEAGVEEVRGSLSGIADELTALASVSGLTFGAISDGAGALAGSVGRVSEAIRECRALLGLIPSDAGVITPESLRDGNLSPDLPQIGAGSGGMVIPSGGAWREPTIQGLAQSMFPLRIGGGASGVNIGSIIVNIDGKRGDGGKDAVTAGFKGGALSIRIPGELLGVFDQEVKPLGRQ